MNDEGPIRITLLATPGGTDGLDQTGSLSGPPLVDHAWTIEDEQDASTTTSVPQPGALGKDGFSGRWFGTKAPKCGFRMKSAANSPSRSPSPPTTDVSTHSRQSFTDRTTADRSSRHNASISGASRHNVSISGASGDKSERTLLAPLHAAAAPDVSVAMIAFEKEDDMRRVVQRTCPGNPVITLLDRTVGSWLYLVDPGRGIHPVVAKLVRGCDRKKAGETREATMMRALPEGTRHVVRLLRTASDAETGVAILLLEYCAGKALRARCKQYPYGRIPSDPPALTPELTHELFRQLVDAVKSCHERRFIHGDIKPCNVLLTGDRTQARLADFGLAVTEDEVMTRQTLPHQLCSRWYRSPELLLGCQRWSEAIDIWALGCTFGEMLFHAPLFPTSSDDAQLGFIFGVLGTPMPRGSTSPMPRGSTTPMSRGGTSRPSLCDDNHKWSLPTLDCPSLIACPDASRILSTMPSNPLRGGLRRWPETYGGGGTPIPRRTMNLLLCMLDPEPDRRPTARRILEHACLVEESI